jgi:uncharacterized OB-fold protein
VTPAKPSPTIDVWNKPFWDACASRRLLLQRCGTTGKCWYPPAPNSPYAPRGPWEWSECSGRGTVLSWVVFHQKYFDGFADEIPYAVAMVRLAEGATVLTNIQGDRGSIAVGSPVEVAFEDRGSDVVPVFRLVPAAS